MNWNLATIAITIFVLGAFATFDIIPGAGFAAGVAMLAIGGAIFIVQLLERNTSGFWRRASPGAVGHE